MAIFSAQTFRLVLSYRLALAGGICLVAVAHCALAEERPDGDGLTSVSTQASVPATSDGPSAASNASDSAGEAGLGSGASASVASGGFALQPSKLAGCVASASSTPSNGTALQLADCTDSSQQRWRLDGGYFSLDGNLCLTQDTSAISLAPCVSGTVTQQWRSQTGYFFSKYSYGPSDLVVTIAGQVAPYPLSAANKTFDGTSDWVLGKGAAAKVASQFFYRGDTARCLADVNGALRLVPCSANDASQAWYVAKNSVTNAAGRCLSCDQTAKILSLDVCSADLKQGITFGHPAGLACLQNDSVMTGSGNVVGNGLGLTAVSATPTDFWTFGGPAFMPR